MWRPRGQPDSAGSDAAEREGDLGALTGSVGEVVLARGVIIGDVVAAGSPGPGAGAIETPGVADLDWALWVPEDGDITSRAGDTLVWQRCLGCTEIGSVVLEKGGTYEIEGGEDGDDATGTYQFQTWNVPPPSPAPTARTVVPGEIVISTSTAEPEASAVFDFDALPTATSLGDSR